MVLDSTRVAATAVEATAVEKVEVEMEVGKVEAEMEAETVLVVRGWMSTKTEVVEYKLPSLKLSSAATCVRLELLVMGMQMAAVAVTSTLESCWRMVVGGAVAYLLHSL